MAENTVTVSSAAVQYYANLGLLDAGTVIQISGSSGADGTYTIGSVAYTDSTIVFSLLEPFASTISAGSVTIGANSAALTVTPFDVRLGRSDLFDDGLMGFFRDGDYATFNAVHIPTDMSSAGYIDVIGSGNYLSVRPFAERSEPPSAGIKEVPSPGSEFVTMLIDPRAGVYVSTGVQPTQKLSLPAKFFESPLSRLELNFRVGPIIVDSETIRLPRPTEQSGTWSWIEKDATGNDANAWQEDPITPVAKKARLSRLPQELRDGWMKLTSHDFNSD